MNKTLLLLLLIGFQSICMQRDLGIIYTQHAQDKMKTLKVRPEEVRDVIINGDRYEDADNDDSIIYAQRSALPRYSDKSREYDQLVAVVSKEAAHGKNKVITVYYNEGGLIQPEKPEKKVEEDWQKIERKKREKKKQAVVDRKGKWKRKY